MSAVAGNQAGVFVEELRRCVLGGSPPFFSIGNRGGPLQRDPGEWSIESEFPAKPPAANTAERDLQPSRPKKWQVGDPRVLSGEGGT